MNMRKTLLTTSVIGLTLLCAGCEAPSAGNSPQEMFENLVERPVPSEVTNVQGVGDSVQDHSIWLRFNAPESYVKKLVESGYNSVECGPHLDAFTLPEGYDIFTPAWDALPHECYQGFTAGDWGYSYNMLGFDAENEQIYFYSATSFPVESDTIINIPGSEPWPSEEGA